MCIIAFLIAILADSRGWIFFCKFVLIFSKITIYRDKSIVNSGDWSRTFLIIKRGQPNANNTIRLIGGETKREQKKSYVALHDNITII